MDMRSRAKHARQKQPIGTTCWRSHKRPGGGRYKVKMVKVAHAYYGGSGRWINYSRYLFEKYKGPVPKGKRVIHADGDLTNHALSNLVLGTAADVLWTHCHADPEKSAANYRAAGEATAKFNREMASVRRQLGVLPSRWYAVDLAGKKIINKPGRKLHDATGLPCLVNGSGVIGWRLGWPGMPASDACMLAALVQCRSMQSHTAIAGLVEQLRHELLIEPARLGVTTLRCSAVRLVRDGLVERLSRGLFRATDKATAERGPVCPFVFLRGEDLREEPYTAFQRVDPEAA